MSGESRLKAKIHHTIMIKMEYSELPIIRISGSGRATIPGYGTLKVAGSARVEQDTVSTSGSSTIPGGLKLRDIRASGSTRVDGDLTADMVTFSGSANIEGSLTCEELKKSGSLRVGGSLKTHYASLSGSSHVSEGGDIGKEIEASGSIHFGDDLVSEDRILYTGVMRVEGVVRAKSFEARLSKDESIIRDGIISDYINIQRSHNDWRNNGSLETTDITGEDLLIENTKCDNIKGKNVTIKKGCLVTGIVEYSESIQIDPDSTLYNEPVKTGELLE